MKKKYMIIFILICLIVFIIIKYNSENDIVTYINWKINIPNSSEVTEKYNIDLFQDGFFYEIHHYSEEQIVKLIKGKKFNSMDINKAKNILERHRNYIDDDCKIIFDELDMNLLLKANNLYFYSEKHENCFVLMILDIDNNNLHYFSAY